MRFLLMFPGRLAVEAKDYAIPVRHRRHHVFLREIEQVERYPEAEACDGLILMTDEAMPEIPAILTTLYPETDVRIVRAGDPVWDADADETQAMNPLNTLRHDAALLGIEVDPAFDEIRLSTLINEKRSSASEALAADELEATRIAALADAARMEREAGATRDAAGGKKTAVSRAAPPPPADAGLVLLGEGSLLPPTDPLVGVDLSNALELRAFAKAHNIPVSPNKGTGAEKLLAAVRRNLGE